MPTQYANADTEPIIPPAMTRFVGSFFITSAIACIFSAEELLESFTTWHVGAAETDRDGLFRNATLYIREG